MWKYLAIGATFAFAAAVQPGPFQTYLVAETLGRGWRRTLPAAFAPLISDAPIILVALAVLTRIPGGMIRFLHLAGAAFLFYLSYGAYANWRDFDPAGTTEPTSGHRTLGKAALVNFLNPNPWLGWSLVMGPIFLEGYAEAPSHGFALLVGFYGTMVLSLAGIITLFAFAGRMGPRVTRATLGLSVLALALFGLYQVWLGLSG